VERTRAYLAQRAVRDRDRVVEYAIWDELSKRMEHPSDPRWPVFFRNNFVDWFPGRHGDDFIGLWGLATIAKPSGRIVGAGRWPASSRASRSSMRSGKATRSAT